MGNFFNIDGGFFSVTGKIFDLFFVSILFTICCIPIITIGPATTALYYSVVKSIRRERGYVSKEFFRSFKQNLRQGAVLSIIIVVAFLLLSFNFRVVRAMDGKKGSILFGVYLAMSIISINIMLYVFPNLSRFTLTIKQLFKNSAMMSVRHFLSTVIMLIIFVVTVMISYLVPVSLMFSPGLCALLISFMMEKILKQYTPADPDCTDAWYLE